jgi:hypothetical protein
MGIFRKKKKVRDCILTSTSPLTGCIAEVIIENDCSYLYVHQTETTESKSDFKMLSSCWIKNHTKVDDTYSPRDDMKRGLQPKVPTKYCAFKDDISFFKAEQLEIIWGKEGLIASLYENGELICVATYWAGYSKYSNTSDLPATPFPLGSSESNVLFQRMDEAKEFWKQDFNKIWISYSDSYLSELESKYGKHVKYFAIDGGGFPPKALVTFETDDMKYAFTIGVGLFPQPKVDMHIDDYKNHELFELGFCYRANAEFDELNVFSQISSITAVPWARHSFFDHRHTIDLYINARYNGALLISNKSVNLNESKFLSKENVNLLWLMPITQEVYEKLISESSDNSGNEIMISSADIVYKD